ncbi:MAG: hypothetical protein ABIO40_05230 [Devosia sp.]
MAAGRGVFGLLIGERKAPGYFDFSSRGLAGSFIAFVLVTALNAGLPIMLGMVVPPGTFSRSLFTVGILFALQVGFSLIVLRQLKRLDGFVPYLVADNWATFFLTLISGAFAAAGVAGDVLIVMLGIVIIVLEINIARLVITLSPLQIAMFIIARMVGASLGILIARFAGLIPELQGMPS